MRYLILIFLFLSVASNAQLVNDMQRHENREDILKAFEQKKILKISDGKYAVLDINYFYLDSLKSSGENSYYQWASSEGFKVPLQNINLSDIKVKNLKTGKVATLRYPEIYTYQIFVLKKKVKLRHEPKISRK